MTAAIITEVNGEPSVEASTVHALLDLRPRGIVVIGDLPDETPLASVPETIPVIKVFTIPATELSGVVNLRSNDEAGMQMIVNHLQENKHSSIAYIGPVDSDVDRSRYEGYLHAMSKKKLKTHTFICDRSEEGGYNQAKQALDGNHNITALVCFNDLVAVGAQVAINEHQKETGKLIALTGYDNTHLSSLPQTSITSVDQDKDIMAKKAAELLCENKPWATLAGKDILFTPTLIVRDSTK